MISVFVLALVIVFVVYPDVRGPQIINEVAAQEESGTTNQTLIVQRICDWEITHLNQGPFTNELKLYLMRIRTDADWIAVLGVGNCQEFSVLFQAISTKAGVSSRIVYDIADDHQWNEFLDPVSGKWIPVDATIASPDNINNSMVYTRDWGKHLSYVYYMDQGNPIDITDTYLNSSEFGTLTISVQNMQPGTSLEIYSWSLMDSGIEQRSIYEMGIVPDATYILNSSGIGNIRLGTNNYTIVAKTGFLYGMRAESKVFVEKGQDTLVQLTMNPSFQAEDMTILEMISNLILFFMAFISLLFFISHSSYSFKEHNTNEI